MARAAAIRCTTLRVVSPKETVVSPKETKRWLRPQSFPAEYSGRGSKDFLGIPQPLRATYAALKFWAKQRLEQMITIAFQNLSYVSAIQQFSNLQPYASNPSVNYLNAIAFF